MMNSKIFAVAIAVAATLAGFAAISSTPTPAYADKPDQFHSIYNSQYCFFDFYTGEEVCVKEHSNSKTQIK